MKNIIINSRLVSNTTFATRFVSFLKNIEVSDPMSQEELEYMQRVASSLLELQIDTATEKEEREYLQRCHNEKTLRLNETKYHNIGKGDTIVILSRNDRSTSKYFTIGAKFEAVSSKLIPRNPKRFENTMTLKYGVNHDYDYSNFQLFLNDLIEFQISFIQEVVVKLPNNTKYKVRSDLYGYGVISNGI